MIYRRGQRIRRKRFMQAIPVVAALVVGLAGGALLANFVRSPQIDLVGVQSTKDNGTSQMPKVTSTAKDIGASAHALPPAAPLVPQARQSDTPTCGALPPGLTNLAAAASPELRKLAQYEQLCSGALASRSAFFVPTPSNPTDAQAYASGAATRLKEYAKYGIAPLVYLEPNTDDGTSLDLSQYQAGAYNAALDAYFAALKSNGITDSMMGMWVLIPEGNIPGWGNVDPAIFAADVTITAQYQKKYFPSSQSTILLDSETYPSATSWSNGAYTSLVPYVQNIPKGLLDSFGLEGFPWVPPANQAGRPQYDPHVYLRTDLAAQAAQALGVTSIWLNTGTFHQMHAGNAAEAVIMSPAQRQASLSSVVAQTAALKKQGFTVALHLFAQNKAGDPEGTDWSYWQTKPGDTADTSVLVAFVHDLNAANVPLWLFDAYDQ